jgi:CheY-like chemotaxis protein
VVTTDMLGMVGRLIGEDVKVVLGLRPEPALVVADRGQVEQIVMNLAVNARDAMPTGGTLTIEAANVELDEHYAAMHLDVKPGPYVALTVTDTGTGMTPDVIARAFDPFFTTKPLGQGTGLGLSMIYGFVRQSGGQVRIYSEPGYGTTMCLYLPRHVGVEGEGDAISRCATPDYGGAGETVLVIDDDPTVRMLIVDVLEEAGYQAIEAVDGAAGLKVLQSEVRIDLLITDVGLPGGMNGRQVADAGRSLRPDLKVLFITGYAENAVVGNGHLDPGMQIVTKPFAIESLGNKIREMLDR